MKIIVVDDEKIIIEALVDTIKDVMKDADITTFTNPKEMLDYVKANPFDVVFLDIEMATMNGIEAAKQLKLLFPKANIIFVTGYNEYAIEAFKMKASGYVMKPFNKEDIRNELTNLRNEVVIESSNQLVVKCFGNFDLFYKGKSISFEKGKTKELFAYLVDRKGSSVTSGELRAVLWENAINDKNTGSYLQKLKRDLVTTLKKYGLEDVFITSWNKYSIDISKIECDYYDYLNNKPRGIQAYNGEYMSQYSWARFDKKLD